MLMTSWMKEEQDGKRVGGRWGHKDGKDALEGLLPSLELTGNITV